MFDDLVDVATRACGAGAVAAWARVENAAAARRLSAIAEVLEARMTADDSAEREQWCLDNWDAVAAEIAAIHQVSPGVASHQLTLARALREQLPRVAEVFTAGHINLRLVNAIVYRTALITDPDAAAKVDTELAAHITGWGSWSTARIEKAIDYWVDRYDPHALRRTEHASRTRYLDIKTPADGSGVTRLEGILLAHDGDALDNRLAAMARGVCDADPRTLDQRRSDAIGALGHGADQLTCGCGIPECPAADAPASNPPVLHVIAEERSLADDTPVQLNGATPQGPSTAELQEMTPAQALAPDAPTGPARSNPAAIIGGGIIPAPLLAATLAKTATIRPLIHPGDAPPENRYTPSRALADFVRCRDMTCRFPGCDQPADNCDLDHTIAYPAGPTCASNLKCLCRKHHLLKTFWGWRDEQSPDGTMVWTSPRGQTYTTHPGSRLLFPSLCNPTAPVTEPRVMPAEDPARTLKMPRRTQTREQSRAQADAAERRLNEPLVAERNKPPPF